MFSLLPTVGVLFLIYVFFHFRYYQTEKHLFDPFLQLHKSSLNLQNYNEDEFVVLALGGSTTRNARLDLEDRYPRVLEKELQKKYPSAKVRVINAGMDWYTSKHSLINYITYYRKVKPDAVIIMNAINDMYRSFSPPEFAVGEYNNDYSHFYGPSINGATPITFEESLLKPVLLYWFTTFTKVEAFNFDLSYYKSIDAYRYNLKTLIKCIKQDSSKCFLLEQRSLYKEEMNDDELKALWIGDWVFNDGEYYSNHISLFNAMNAFNKAGKEVAEQENIPFIEVGNNLESSLEYFLDDVHYTKKGSHTLAKIVYDSIVKSEIISNK